MKRHWSYLDSGGKTLCGRFANLVTILDGSDGEAEEDICKTCLRAFDANFGDNDD